MKTAIDGFAGLGGGSCGLIQAGFKVIVAINHLPLSKKVHQKNNPRVRHYVEDIRKCDVSKLPKKVNVLHFSLPCPEYSLAKNGKPIDNENRTIAWNVPNKYVPQCNPDFVVFENVRGFKKWGRTKHMKDENGNLLYDAKGNAKIRPITDKNGHGIYYKAWVKKMKALGYMYKSMVLESDKFGIATARDRLFGVFYKPEFSFSFPTYTHATPKEAKKYGLKPFTPCSKFIDFSDEGVSIFSKESRIRSDNTYKKIEEGVKKFHKNTDMFYIQYYGKAKPKTIDAPLLTITPKDRFGLCFIYKDHGNASYHSLHEPAKTITKIDKHNLVTLHKAFYLSDYENFGRPIVNINEPHPTIVASKRYTRLGGIHFEGEKLKILESDSPGMKSLKQTCIDLGIRNITKRMLRPDELLQIQGFPKDYYIEGTIEEQKALIGDSIPPIFMKKIGEQIMEAYARRDQAKIAV